MLLILPNIFLSCDNAETEPFAQYSQITQSTWINHVHLLEQIQHRCPADLPPLVQQTSASHTLQLWHLRGQTSLLSLDQDQTLHPSLSQPNPTTGSKNVTSHITSHSDPESAISASFFQLYGCSIVPVFVPTLIISKGVFSLRTLTRVTCITHRMV